MNIENAELNDGMLIIPQEDGSTLCIPEEDCTSDEAILFAQWRGLYPDGKPQPLIEVVPIEITPNTELIDAYEAISMLSERLALLEGGGV